jgi:hypothetical protein
MSVFLVQNCKFDGESYANSLYWSNCDPIAAVASYTIDDQDRETHQILVVNNEVRSRIRPGNGLQIKDVTRENI